MFLVMQTVSDILVAYRRSVVAVVIILAVWVLSRLSLRWSERVLRIRSQNDQTVRNFLFIQRYVWLSVITIITVSAFSGSLATMGLSAAFIGMVMGWSLQAPVTGVAAWLMILVKRPFKIGDRVIINGIIGDVTDITLTHVVLNQVGGTVGGEEKSGRAVLIPNATLFQQTIHNYTLDNEYILDEVPVLVTYDSDVTEAERILIACAREVTEPIIRATGLEPFVRLELDASGIRLRLRYNAPAVDRQRISSDIVRAVVREFRTSPLVEFAYPHMELVHRPERAGGRRGQEHVEPRTGNAQPVGRIVNSADHAQCNPARDSGG